MHEPFQHLYIHVPFCDGRCSYCGFYSEKHTPARAEAWLNALAREFDLHLRMAGCGQAAAQTVFMGGGTPSVLSVEHLEQLCQLIKTRLKDYPAREWTVEANPGTLTSAKVEVLAGPGVNRVSLGVQTLDDALLRLIGRRHTADDALTAIDLLRQGGVENVGIDLIASLPGLSDRAWEGILHRVVGLDLAHVSVYTLTPEKDTPLAEHVRSGRLALPDADSQLRALDIAEDVLTATQYERYEVSNYARPGKACRHNMAYWRGEDYLGIGPAASSRCGRLRRTNARDLDAYIAAPAGKLPPSEETKVAPEDDVTERLMFGLRLAEGIDLSAFCDRHGVYAQALRPRWEANFRRLEQEALVKREGGRWTTTRRGRQLADGLAEALLD